MDLLLAHLNWQLKGRLKQGEIITEKQLYTDEI